eukprot:g7009.t1
MEENLQIQTNGGPQILRIRCLTETDFEQLQAFLKQEDLLPRKQNSGEKQGGRDDANAFSIEHNVNKSKDVVDTSKTNSKRSKHKSKSHLLQTQSKNATSSKTCKRISEAKASEDYQEESITMLRSLGKKLRTTSSKKGETRIKAIPIEEQFDILPKSSENEAEIDYKHESPEYQLGEKIENSVNPKVSANKNQELRLELNEALQSLNCQDSEDKRHVTQLETLQSKVELLVYENERLEAANDELDQSVTELNSEIENHKRTIDVLKDANEDIFSKFEDLRQELHTTKDELLIRNAEHKDLLEKATKLESEKKQWTCEIDSGKQTLDEIEASRMDERQSFLTLERSFAALKLENEELMAKCEQLRESNDVGDYAKEEAQNSLREANLQVEQLVNLVARKESALSDIKRTESERVEELREALEKAQNAEHEALLARKREQEKTSQLELLTRTLNEQRREITNTLQTEKESELDNAQQHISKLDKEVSRLKSEMLKAELKTQQLLHDKELLEKRIKQLTTSMTSSQISCSLTGITVASVAELERIQRLEIDRQGAIEDLQKSRKGHEIYQKKSEIIIYELKAEIDSLRNQIRDVISEKNSLEAMKVQLKREVDAIKTQLKTEKANAIAMESRLSQENRVLEESFAEKLEKFNEKGGRSLERLQKELIEAEALIVEKDEIQNKWKKETKRIAAQLEAVAQDHTHEKSISEREILSLKNKLRTAEKNSEKLFNTVVLFKKQQLVLKQQLSGVLRDNTILEQHLHRLYEKHTRLIEAYNNSSLKIKNLKEVKLQLEKERDSFGIRYETIRKRTQSHMDL